MQLQTFFVCLSGLLEEAPPSLRTHRFPQKKRKKNGWVMRSFCSNGGGWQKKKDGGEKDQEDPLLLGSGTPSPSGQLAMPSATA